MSNKTLPYIATAAAIVISGLIILGTFEEGASPIGTVDGIGLVVFCSLLWKTQLKGASWGSFRRWYGRYFGT